MFLKHGEKSLSGIQDLCCNEGAHAWMGIHGNRPAGPPRVKPGKRSTNASFDQQFTIIFTAQALCPQRIFSLGKHEYVSTGEWFESAAEVVVLDQVRLKLFDALVTFPMGLIL